MFKFSHKVILSFCCLSVLLLSSCAGHRPGPFGYAGNEQAVGANSYAVNDDSIGK
jgi:hypothetical protein